MRAREGERLCVQGDWYDTDGDALAATGRVLVSATMAGDQPYGDLNGRLSAQLYLLRDRVEQWNPHNPEMTGRIDTWNRRIDMTAADVRDTEWNNSTGPTSLLNSASDLNLASGRADRWMGQIGVQFGRQSHSTEHARRIADIQASTADLESPEDAGIEPGG